MSDLKVGKGDAIRAESWNQLVDRLPGSNVGRPASPGNISRTEIEVVNGSGRNYDVGEIFYVNSFSGPTGNAPWEAIETPLYSGIEPIWHSKISRLCVAAQPIPDGEQGVAVVSGHCVIKTTNDSTTLGWIMLDPSTEYQGKLADAGIAKVLGKIANGWYLCNFGETQRRWRYKLSEASQAPSTTTATLYLRDGTQWDTTTFELSDSISITDGDALNYEGFCEQVDNEFLVHVGPC